MGGFLQTFISAASWDIGRFQFLTRLSLSQFAERKFGPSTYLSQKVK